MIGKNILHYRILERLGEGGMGIVYLAEDQRLDRRVAIKFLPKETARSAVDRDRFQQEARAAAAFSHPNIATIYAIEELDEQLFIVMEYIEGQTLEDFLKAATTPTDINLLLDFATQIAAGLQAAHHKNIIHRDIKSANIMLDKWHRIKIMDFGLAKGPGQKKLTEAGATLGTLAYMAPEQFQGIAGNKKSDIWSFGILLYELLAGKTPFAGEYPQAVMYEILNEAPAPLIEFREDIPENLQTLIYHCLRKSADERPASMDEICQALARPAHHSHNQPKADAAPKGNGLPNTATVPLKRYGVSALLVLGIIAIAFLGKNWISGKSIPQQKHILVLPFKSIQKSESNQAFCDGLTETLASQLSQLEQFQDSFLVVPLSEVLEQKINSAGQANQAFGANLVVAGSVQRVNKVIRLTMNLVDARHLRTIQSAVITDSVRSILQFQDQVVERLATMLNINLHPPTRAVLTAGNTSVPDAYDYYIQGRGYLLNYADQENIEAAIRLFQQALNEDNNYALAFAGLGEAYWRQYRYSRDPQWIELALENCKKALEHSNQLAPVHITMGMIYRGQGRYEDALQHLQQALKIDPVNSDAFRGLAITYARLGKTDAVEKTYLKAIELKPDYWDNYYKLGLFYFRNGKKEMAEKQLLYAAKLSPLNYRVYRDLGVIYSIMERYEEALKMSQRSIDISPNYGAYSNIGTILFEKQEFEKAAENFEQALQINDRAYALWGNLATCYIKMNLADSKISVAFDKAIQLAEKELAVNPKNPRVLWALANYYAKTGQPQAAREHLNHALELDPTNVELMFRAAEILGGLGDHQPAAAQLTLALKNGYSLQRIQQSSDLSDLIKMPAIAALIDSVKSNQ